MSRAITALFTSIVFSAAVFATAPDTAVIPIEKQSEQTALYREIFDRLATRHYRGQVIDDDLSRRYLEHYIDQLDSTKSYFLQSDIDEFNQWQTRLDDLAKRGDVSPGFIMFNRLRERATVRLRANIALLENPDYKFDYSLDESIILDGDKRDWLGTAEQADDFWRKRLKDSMIRLLLNDKEEDAARELLVKRYSTQITQYQQRDSQDVFQLYINALASLYDPHTSYFTPRTTENFQINMSLSLTGIGAELNIEDEYTRVVRIIPGGPADLQGLLKASDKIAGVGQGDGEIVDVVGWRLDDVVALIRGEKDSTVRLQVIPSKGAGAGSSKVISIVRDKVKLEEKSAQSKVLDIVQDDRNYKLGVIDIPAFYLDFEAYRNRDPDYRSTTKDVLRLLEELEEQGVDGIVLDLRNNGGGSLYEATALTDLFIGYGPVVQIRDANQRVYRNQRATRPPIYQGPMLVMINRLSASASEIFAGAMQDYGRALVVGSQSFGKGTVQDVTGLSAGQLKMTTSKFYRVSGDSTQHRGVLPDIAFPSAYDPEEVGESHRDYALPWDRIRAVPHSSTDELQPLVAPLLEAHKQRSQNDPDYAHMLSQLELTKSWSQQDALSLNIEARRARSKKWDDELFTLENIRRKKKGLELYADIEAWKAESEPDTDSELELASSDADEQDQDSEELDEDEDIAETDPMLQEAGYILSDQIRLGEIAKQRQLQLVQLEQQKAS
ncbi:carboxy terminal-processing peptidase [Porticoccaceae bacterium]|nr:carboxy terminal-processing peptidase [Porticoccaceae bacterium]